MSAQTVFYIFCGLSAFTCVFSVFLLIYFDFPRLIREYGTAKRFAGPTPSRGEGKGGAAAPSPAPSGGPGLPPIAPLSDAGALPSSGLEPESLEDDPFGAAPEADREKGRKGRKGFGWKRRKAAPAQAAPAGQEPAPPSEAEDAGAGRRRGPSWLRPKAPEGAPSPEEAAAPDGRDGPPRRGWKGRQGRTPERGAPSGPAQAGEASPPPEAQEGLWADAAFAEGPGSVPAAGPPEWAETAGAQEVPAQEPAPAVIVPPAVQTEEPAQPVIVPPAPAWPEAGAGEPQEDFGETSILQGSPDGAWETSILAGPSDPDGSGFGETSMLPGAAPGGLGEIGLTETLPDGPGFSGAADIFRTKEET